MSAQANQETLQTPDDPFFVDAGIGRRAALVHAALLWESLFLNDQIIHFPRPDTPAVSVVIVSYNAPHLLAQTLVNLAKHETSAQASFETIIIDNASHAPNLKLFERLRGAAIVKNTQNIGFGPACNQGARLARGRRILFLNPDVELTPGALNAMVEAFDLFSNVGIVGARLVFPGGILQEAGATFAPDAQVTHPYLRGCLNASAPEALFVREVGYVSGAALMIERSLFESLGGFDKIYAPAYFEDSDLCVRAAQSGKRVVYQPRATIIHYEHATAPTHENVKNLLDAHRVVFLNRHRNWLFESGNHPAGFMRREPDRHRQRALYIDDQAPHIDKGSGLPRANSIVNAMAAMGYVTTIAPLHACDAEVAARYRDIDPRIEILAAEGEKGLRNIIRERASYYDVVWVSRPHNIGLTAKCFLEMGVSPRKWASGRIIFDAEALFCARDALSAMRQGKAIDMSELTRAIAAETAFARMADLVVCVTPGEEKLLRLYGGLDNVRVLGDAFALQPGPAAFSERAGIVFVGPLANAQTPNADSVFWFLDHVWPRIHANLKNARFDIVGEISPDLHDRLERPGVRLLGRIDRLDAVFNQVRLAIAPTRFAAGIPQKAHQCAAHGLPMVLTPLLASQLGWGQKQGCVIAPWQDPEAFADAVIQLHADGALWEETRANGLERMARECNPDDFSRRLRDICEERIAL